MRLQWVLPFIVLLPATTWSEGAIRILDCSFVRQCDAAGMCAPESGVVRLRMEPLTIEPDGAGRYSLRYGDVQADMEAQSPAGPFLWLVGEERNTLLASSETQFLWHRLTLAPAPKASIRFMTCNFRQ